MWGRLTTMLKAAKGLDFNSALFFVFSQNAITTKVIELNTDGQLFDKGIDAEGVRLDSIGGGYAPKTIQQKQFDSLPFDRVTLFQEGSFYKSFKVKVNKTGIAITADTIKDGDDLQNRWGDEILGLTDESKQELYQDIIPLIAGYIRSTLLR